jgi:hypothetical protein
MIFEVHSNEKKYLEKLGRALNYELSSSLLLLVSYLWPLLAVAAILFTPFMLFSLWRAGKTGWLVTFGIMVILPIIAFLIFGRHSGYVGIALFIPLGFFYLYTFLLRLSINDRVNELRAKEKSQLESKLRKEELVQWQKTIDDKIK